MWLLQVIKHESLSLRQRSSEETYKIIKTEFVNRRHFDSLEELSRQFRDYVHWYNYTRIHGTLDYLSPIEFKLKHLKKIV